MLYYINRLLPRRHTRQKHGPAALPDGGPKMGVIVSFNRDRDPRKQLHFNP
jgi:hypothetical protein